MSGTTEFYYHGQVTVTNECGSRTKEFIVSEPAISNPNLLLVFKVGNNQYQVVDPTNPNQNSISSPELYTTFGTQIDNCMHSGDEVQLDENGFPVFRVLKVSMNGK